MSYIITKTIQTYYDALMHYDLKEKDISRIKKSGGVLIIEDRTKNKLYFRSIIR